MRSALVAAAVACGGCGDDGNAAPDARVGVGWSAETPVGHGAIQETAAVSVAGKIYVLGGFDGDEGIVARVQIYDTSSGAWSDGPDLPRALHHANVATDGVAIYVVGALAGNGFTAIGDVYRFMPGVDTSWQSRTSMPSARERGAAVADFIGGSIYVAAGLRDLQASDLVDRYDPVLDTWMSLANLPSARDHACGGALGGRLVVAGGRMVATSQSRADVWLYDVGSNTWSAKAPMPTARGGMGCGVIDEILFTAGGEGNPAVPSGVFADVESYSPATDMWRSREPMLDPKHGVGGAVWDGALYLCGGASVEGFGAIATTSVLRP